ncbi:MAG: 2-dehydropantoate 2-reductase [Daejeonella sp.]
MAKKIRIIVVGIGAVGGFFGGMLAKKYAGSTDVEIDFIARERSVNAIKENGLKIITPDYDYLVHPDKIDVNDKDFGLADYIIIAVKSYDLAESLKSVHNSIGPETVILPLLNGVDSREKIQKVYPSANVWDGCAYIVSRLTDPGVITESGTLHSIHFGSDFTSTTKLKEFENILNDAEIVNVRSSDIQKTIWEKYIFISAVASLTCALDQSVGQILLVDEDRQRLISLFEESRSIAQAKGVNISDKIVENSLSRLGKLPFETTSSMHADFARNSNTEYVSLTKHIVDLGKQLAVPTPSFERCLREIKKAGIKPA